MATAPTNEEGAEPAESWPALTFVGEPPPDLSAALESAARQARSELWATRLWARDVRLWPGDETERKAMAERLGWLDAPASFADMTAALDGFAASIAEEVDGAVLAGMGGSSLAPALFASTFDRAPDRLPLIVLDSTDPEAVLAADRARPPAETLYLIATKSGTTTETLAFLEHFLATEQAAAAPNEDALERLQDLAHPGPELWESNHFVAITDPGASVERIPYSNRFREVFLNPPDVGGRYSALTYVGLVPAALIGVDIDKLLRAGTEMTDLCRGVDPASNPGLALGLAMGAFALAGRDKLTLVIDPRIGALGAWVEQLVAESTGKRGRGIVPVDGEELGPPEAYGDDRFFVSVELDDGGHTGRAATTKRVDALAAAGHPIVTIRVPDLAALGGEFFRWEFATAVAGAVIGVNPFDEPNVTESKRNTDRILHERPSSDAGIPAGDPSLVDRLTEHLAGVPEHGYVALTAFIAPTAGRDAALAKIRHAVRDATKRATTVGFGPRYLHSTGQLHKGGPPIGSFLQLVADHPSDVEIPGRGYGFATLIDAQADGDLASLQAHGLPVLRVHLGADPDAGLTQLDKAVGQALSAARS